MPSSVFTANQILTTDEMNSLPFGGVATASTGTTQTGITTIADLTGLSVTFTALALRRYLILAQVNFRQISASGLVIVQIVRGTSTVLNSALMNLSAASEYGTLSCMYAEVPGAGSTTYKLRASTSAGTLTINPNGSSDYLSTIRVIDIGQ